MTVPFFIAFFDTFENEFLLMNLAIDGALLLDIFFNFFTTHVNHSGEITDRRQIVKSYLRGEFAIDVFSLIPFDVICAYAGLRQNNKYYLSLLANMLKITKLRRISRLIRTWQASEVYKAAAKMFELLLYLFFWVHFTACIWFIEINYNQSWSPLLWAYRPMPSMYDLSIFYQYFICFYNGVWLTVGNDVQPTTEGEYGLASLLIVAGSVGISVLLGEMAVIMTNLNSQEEQFQEIIDEAMTNLSNLGIPGEMIMKVLNRITEAQSSLRSHEEYAVFKKFVSPSIQQKIADCLYAPILKSNIVFSNENRNSLEILLKKMQISFTRDEQEVISEGSESKAMYFLISGEMKVMVMDTNTKKNTKVCFLKPGSHFGELGLVYKTQRRATVISEGYSTIGELRAKDFYSIHSNSPQISSKLKDFSMAYNDPQTTFIIQSLSSQEYFLGLPEKLMHEMPFIMKIIKIEKGSYLFKPGDTPNCIYVVSEGRLELSATINDKYIQYVKIEEGYADISLIKSSRRAKVENYSNRKFDIFSANGLKRKPQIFPYIKPNGKLACVKSEAAIPYNSTRLGIFLQEIVLAEINRGALINSRIAIGSKVHDMQLQCKALSPCFLYCLEPAYLKHLTRDNEKFRNQYNNTVDHEENNKKKGFSRAIDVINSKNNSADKKILWKDAIIRVILNNRNEMRKQGTNIAGLTRKINAIIACENAGNLELAEKVMSGEILPEYITEEGRLVVNVNQETAGLPSSHPIIHKFKESLEELSNPNSGVINNYNKFASGLLEECTRVENLKKGLKDMKMSLEKYIERSKKEIIDQKKKRNLEPAPLEFPKAALEKKRKPNLLDNIAKDEEVKE